jgi:hypothetical protein
VHQLLWLETLLKAGCGLALVVAPVTVIRLLGLSNPGHAFWPRLLGAVLIGCGAAAYIEGAWPQSRGLGLAGIVIINLLSSGALAAMLMLGAAAPSRRGTFVVWSAVVLLFVLSLVEIAHA